MSSHHIIRDEQEPALYIHSADNFTLEALGELLEWSPTVLVNLEALKKVIDFGIKVDILTTAPRSEEQEVLVKSQHPIRALDASDQEIATLLQTFESENYTGVNVATMDDQLQLLLQGVRSYTGAMDCTFYTETKRVIRIHSTSFEKWVMPGHFELWSHQPTTISTHGFENDQQNRLSDHLEFSKSDAGIVKIACEELPYWFVEGRPSLKQGQQ